MNYLDHTSCLNLPLLLGLLVAYAFGGINVGYFLVRWRTGLDIRTQGSGNAGARNVGRLLGPWGFGVTLFADMLKGALPLLGATLIGASTTDCLLVLLAVTAGHNWPAQLGFRGGKGLATSFGALLVFNPFLAGAMLGFCALLLAATRRFTLSATVPYLLGPGLALLFGYDATAACLFVILAFAVALPHRRNLQEESPTHPASAHH